MIRKHENIYSWKAGILAIGVHVVLFAGMIISINWKAAHPPMAVTEVVLWDSVPEKSIPKPVLVKKEPEPKPEVKKEPEPKPVVEEKPKEEPKKEEPKKEEPKKEEPKKEEPKVDIALEKKKLEEKQKQEKLLEEKKKQEKIDKLKQAMREESLKEKVETKESDALKKLQQEMLSDTNDKVEQHASAATASLVNEYQAKIAAKIRGHVNRTLCGDGNPVLLFKIDILPTGDLSGAPTLTKTSGNSVCDDAVERAIMASQPLPLPTEPAAKAQFRNLTLKFRPNDE
jgi:colicin import membrane protein